jgi:hypothetical protein
LKTEIVDASQVSNDKIVTPASFFSKIKIVTAVHSEVSDLTKLHMKESTAHT